MQKALLTTAEPPSDLSKGARAAFLTVRDLKGIADPLSLIELVRWARALDREEWAIGDLADNGPTHVDRNGLERSRPAVQILRDAAREQRACLRSLGLDPAQGDDEDDT